MADQRDRDKKDLKFASQTFHGLRAERITELDWQIVMRSVLHSARARSIAKRIVDLCGGGFAIPGVNLHRPHGGWDGLENVETLDFGRDTNRLDYFRAAPFDVNACNADLRGIANYGGGFTSRQVFVGNSSYGGGGGGGGGGSGGGQMVGLELDHESKRMGGDNTRQVAVGIFTNGGGGGGEGEVVVQRLGQERGGAGNVDGSERWIDGEEGGHLEVAGGWWNNWWLLMALWK